MTNHGAASWIWIFIVPFAGFLTSGCSDDGNDIANRMIVSAHASGSGDANGAAGSEGVGDSADGGDAAGTGGAGAGARAMPVDVTWSSLFSVEFWSCSNSDCHGGGRAGVNFATRDTAWSTLVDQPSNPSSECAKLGKRRIVPGDPDNSLVYLKLDVNSPCGQQMPPGGALSDAARERVRAWILNGAKND